MSKWNDNLAKSSVTDFTREEFLAYVTAFFESDWVDEDDRDTHADHFSRIVAPDPRGGDLIYWPEEGVEDTPEGVVEQVEKFRRANGLPGFKEEASAEPDAGT